MTLAAAPFGSPADAAPEPGSAANASAPVPREDIESIEISLLLEAIRRRWSYDFTHYSHASLRRRLDQARRSAGLANFSELLARVLHDDGFFDRLLRYMSVTVTEMFRDPPCYRAMRERLIPVFKTFPFIKIWCAGCATGEEVYSLAILLHEEGYLERTRLYATDFNKNSLDIAEKGIYPERVMAGYAANYQQSGGRADFSDYYSSSYDFVRMKGFLRDRITFSYHNLVTDGIFGEMNLITCRNVLIYFDKTLQEQVLRLFTKSLRHGAYLCLGSKESLNFSEVKPLYEALDGRQKIYKKRGLVTHG
ncbi:CheR family methyltransferase [Novosphingobium aerophilum]|uniref:CheR family methyltransferase n=1 Tax=Novosphingobium TaxID=165696 RepID=UPI0012CAE8E2|nr:MULTISPECIES: protein-glutamate O-methyltransferase CheR [unclassified Novosphingobium]MPS69645.1 protein-glutamate O-methyltransferase CheR [Novosphingobium sp.]WRT94906.1 protein-glutamate O-methyltransferase CheR [Novosphingobium sp. RL4]